MNPHTVSVIIPAFNSEQTIGQSLEAVLEQSYPVSEIIVIDDGSSDKTGDIVRSQNKAQYYFQENQGPAAARNFGFKNSTGEIIFFTDADCIPSHDWIEKAIVHFDDKDVGVVSGSYDLANGNKMLPRLIHNEILFRHQKIMPKFPKFFGSYNFGIKRAVFDEAGGFEQKYKHASGEDNDLSYKIIKNGHKIYFEKESKVAHYHTDVLPHYLKEQFRHGFWRLKMYLDHPDMARGDGYTFWKDILEIQLVCLILASMALVVVQAEIFIIVFLILNLFLMALEMIYGYLISKNFINAFFLSAMMFLRAYARALGFSSAILLYLPSKLTKKS